MSGLVKIFSRGGWLKKTLNLICASLCGATFCEHSAGHLKVHLTLQWPTMGAATTKSFVCWICKSTRVQLSFCEEHSELCVNFSAGLCQSHNTHKNSMLSVSVFQCFRNCELSLGAWWMERPHPCLLATIATVDPACDPCSVAGRESQVHKYVINGAALQLETRNMLQSLNHSTALN